MNIRITQEKNLDYRRFCQSHEKFKFNLKLTSLFR